MKNKILIEKEPSAYDIGLVKIMSFQPNNKKKLSEAV
jgi:hypothetical protein